MSRQYIYQVENLTKKHGQKVVLDDIWLAFYPGAKIGVLGPNGAGKSTLLRIMAGQDTDFDGVFEAGITNFSTSEIRFRYVHDFMYGFDWARWVKKQPDQRANSGPFCQNFLDDLLCRGEEILQSIKKDDVKYPQISQKRYRNPFCFSREPEDERRLLTYLAGCECIPVAAWEWDSVGVWDKPFSQIREEASLKLNIAKK